MDFFTLNKLLLRGSSLSLNESTVCLLIFNLFAINHSFWIHLQYIFPFKPSFYTKLASRRKEK